MGDSVSVREFARQIGRSHTWVQDQVKAGKITPDENGKIPIETGFDEAEMLIGPVNKSGAFVKKKDVTEAFNKARLAEKTYQAKLKEIEYKLKKGELIESWKVINDANATASALRGRLVSIPVRISGLCEGRPAREIEEIIEDAINDALAEFQKSEFLKDDGNMG